MLREYTAWFTSVKPCLYQPPPGTVIEVAPRPAGVKVHLPARSTVVGVVGAVVVVVIGVVVVGVVVVVGTAVVVVGTADVVVGAVVVVVGVDPSPAVQL